MSPPVALPCSRLDNKIIGRATGGVKFQISLARLEHPAFLVRVILIEESQADGVLPVGAAAAPGLKYAGFFDAGLLIEIVPIEDERFVLGVEHAPKGLLGVARLTDVIDFGDVEVAGANQIPDIAVAIEQFPALCDLFVFFLDRFIEIIDLPFKCESLLGVLGGLLADQAESCLQALRIGLRFGQFPIQVGTFLDAAIKVGAPVRQFPFHLGQLVIQPGHLLVVHSVLVSLPSGFGILREGHFSLRWESC